MALITNVAKLLCLFHTVSLRKSFEVRKSCASLVFDTFTVLPNVSERHVYKPYCSVLSRLNEATSVRCAVGSRNSQEASLVSKSDQLRSELRSLHHWFGIWFKAFSKKNPHLDLVLLDRQWKWSIHWLEKSVVDSQTKDLVILVKTVMDCQSLRNLAKTNIWVVLEFCMTLKYKVV